MLLSFLTGTHILPENRNIALRTFKNHKNESYFSLYAKNISSVSENNLILAPKMM